MRRHARPEVERDVQPVIAGAGRTRVAAALQARRVRVAVVPAAVVLQQVPADGTDPADLRRGERTRRQREPRMAGTDSGIGRQHRHRRRRANLPPAVAGGRDPAQVGAGAEVAHRSAADPAAPALAQVGATGPELAHAAASLRSPTP
jgi:hypothetical protein